MLAGPLLRTQGCHLARSCLDNRESRQRQTHETRRPDRPALIHINARVLQCCFLHCMRPGEEPRNPVTDPGNVRALAEAIAGQPYYMVRGAKALLDWLDGAWRKQQLHDISCVARPGVPSLVEPLPRLHGEACGLEPEPGEMSLRVMSDRQRLKLQPPSQRAAFITQVARCMVQGHGKPWAEALEIGKICWGNLDPSYQRAVCRDAAVLT